MSSDYWDLVLTNSSGDEITYFEDKIILVNDYDGQLADSCLKLSDEGNYGYLSDSLEGKWVIDFDTLKIAPHRWYIHYSYGDEHLSAYEQPTFRQARHYVRMKNELIYLTFPFTDIDEIDRVIEEYLEIRKEQLTKTYFGKQ